MDMTLVDVTNIPGVQEGDEVILFGESPTIEEIAQAADTIPYEILSRIPQRVRRLQKGG
jgi:alanine racemase